jgi:hypothetical protein
MSSCLKCAELVLTLEQERAEYRRLDAANRESAERVSQLEEALERIVRTPVTRTWQDWELKIRLAQEALGEKATQEVTIEVEYSPTSCERGHKWGRFDFNRNACERDGCLASREESSNELKKTD